MREVKCMSFTITVDGDCEKDIIESLEEAFAFALKNFKSGKGNVSKDLEKARVYCDPPTGQLTHFNDGKAKRHIGLVAFKKTKAA